MKQSIVVVLAVIGIVFGGIGTFLGLSMKKAETDLNSRVAQVEQSVQQLASDTDAKLKNVGDQVGSNMAVLGTRVGALEAQVADLTNKVAKAKQPEAPVVAADANAKGKEAKPATEPKKGGKEARPANGIYVAAKGDTTMSIAKKFGMKEHTLMEANLTLNQGAVKAGAKIKIP